MSDNIQNLNGRDMFAFMGERREIWHRKGTQMQPGATREEWDIASGHNFEVVKVPAIAALGEANPALEAFKDTEWKFLARRDNGHIFAPCTDTYQTFQPKQADDFGDEYAAVDARFVKNAAGALGHGDRIFTTWLFDDNMSVAGDAVRRYLLISTSFDGTQATRVEATTTRVVCENTLRAAHASAKAVIKTTHRTRFNANQVRRELEQIVSSFDEFKRLGDAMAQVSMSQADCNVFLRNLIDIPLDATRKDVSTRSQNILADLERAVNKTMSERNTRDPDLWCLLNGVTRYVDHDRSVRTDSGARSEIAARFDAGTFGAGDAMKGKAMGLILPILKARQFA